MSCGVPVAAYDRGAVSEVVTEGCGVLADSNDVRSLSKAVLQARHLARGTVRDLVLRRYDLSRMVDRYEDLYRQCQAARAATADAIRFPPWELPDIGLDGPVAETRLGA